MCSDVLDTVMYQVCAMITGIIRNLVDIIASRVSNEQRPPLTR